MLLVCVLLAALQGTEPAPDIVVAPDGTGQFTTLAAALDSIPQPNPRRTVILLKNGLYPETLILRKSNLTLRGQDRHKTRIAFDRPGGRSTDPAGFGVITLDNASDILIQNLTIENTSRAKGYGCALSSRGDSTRIVLLDCDIVGYGGDTLSLWSRGQYYHRNIYVSGTYHFLGPRGCCYVTDSVIHCLGSRIALFNEGLSDENHRLVIKNSRFQSETPFGLGSYFRDAAWYFIDNTFPDTLAPDGDLFHDPKSDPAYIFKWEKRRAYFAGNKGPDRPFLKDNIDSSPAKTKQTITPAWTFGNWDPESTLAPAPTNPPASPGTPPSSPSTRPSPSR